MLNVNFISEEERCELYAWIAGLLKTGLLRNNEVGPFRFFRQTRTLRPPSVHDVVKARVEAVAQMRRESQLGHYVSVIEPGGFVHQHTDYVPACLHYRCNVVVQRAPGGDPIIDGDTVAVPERGMWGFDAGTHQHGTGIVRDKMRVVLGFGFLRPQEASAA